MLFLEGKIDIPAPLWLETSSGERSFLLSGMLLTGNETAKCIVSQGAQNPVEETGRQRDKGNIVK